jgi:hypothetical protein
MANEAVLVTELEPPINFTVADGTGIEKGALLKLADPMTASAADGDTDIIAGIAASEKIANDGTTKLGVYRRGIFKMICSGAIICGSAVTSVATYTNHVIAAPITTSGACAIGHILETAANTETAYVYVNVGSAGSAVS